MSNVLSKSTPQTPVSFDPSNSSRDIAVFCEEAESKKLLDEKAAVERQKAENEKLLDEIKKQQAEQEKAADEL